MMDNLRAASNHFALKIILSLIIVSFVLTGVGGYMFRGAHQYVAKVGEQEITPRQLQMAIQSARNEMRKEFEEQGQISNFDKLMNNEDFVKSQAEQILNELINESLISQYAKKLNITISDEQVKTAIRTDKTFQNEKGQFDNNLYRAFLIRNNLPGEWFAENIRKELEKSQVNVIYSGTDFVTPEELDAQAALFLQKRNIRLAKVDLNKLQENQTVTDEELESTYNQNKQDFAIPERYKVAYVELDAVNIQAAQNVSDDEVKSYYEANKDQFIQSARYNFSVIQVKTHQEADALIGQLKNGSDFASLAKEKSTDTISAAKGGELGWFEPNTMTTEMVTAKLQNEGEISEPIEMGSTYLIFKLNQVEPSKIKTLEQVAKNIKQQLTTERARKEFFALQQKVGDAIHQDPYSFVELEKIPDVKIVETDWFERDNLPAALNHPNLANLLFSNSLIAKDGAPASNSDLLQVDGDRAFVLRIIDHEPEKFKPLSDVREEVLTLTKQQKALTQARSQVKAALAELAAGKSEEEALKSFDGKFSESKSIQRQDAVTDADMSRLVRTVFDMSLPSKDKPVYDISSSNQTVELVAFDSTETEKLPDDLKEPYKQQANLLNNSMTYNSLLANLRTQIKIDINNSQLQ